MPKLDPEDQTTDTTAAAPAATGFGSVAATAPATSSFGSTPLVGSAPATGGFGSGSTGFGGATSFGGQQNNFSAPQNFGGTQGQYQQTDTSAFRDAIEASEGKPEEHWMKSYWRPAMGWLYMLVCFCDFILFPVGWSILQVYNHQQQITQWNPVTLQGAGLFHLAMGAILGIAAYGRTQEKKTGTS